MGYMNLPSMFPGAAPAPSPAQPGILARAGHTGPVFSAFGTAAPTPAPAPAPTPPTPNSGAAAAAGQFGYGPDATKFGYDHDAAGNLTLNGQRVYDASNGASQYGFGPDSGLTEDQQKQIAYSQAHNNVGPYTLTPEQIRTMMANAQAKVKAAAPPPLPNQQDFDSGMSNLAGLVT